MAGSAQYVLEEDQEDIEDLVELEVEGLLNEEPEDGPSNLQLGPIWGEEATA